MADEVLKGASDLIRRLKELQGLDSASALRKALRAGITPALKYAKQAIPVGKKPHRSYKGNLLQPGYASKHLRIVVTKVSETRYAALLGVSKEAFYAVRFVELGTSKMAAEPWLRPAFFATQERQKAQFMDSLKEYLREKSK